MTGATPRATEFAGVAMPRLDVQPGVCGVYSATTATAGPRVETGFTPPAQAVTGARAASYADLWFETLHVAPHEYRRALQLGSEQVPVCVYNAHRDKSVQLTAITQTNTNGTAIDINAPAQLQPTGYVGGTLSIYEDGPVTSSGAYCFDFDGTVIVLPISMTRAVGFYHRHNWATALQFSLAFQTTITTTRQLHERRYCRTSRPHREQSVSVLVAGHAAARAKGLLSNAANRTFGVPLYMEPMTMASVDESNTVLTMSEDLSHFWNLRRYCKAIIALREDGTGFMRQLNKIDTETRKLTVSTPFPDDLTGYLFYPCFFALITQPNVRHLAAEVSEITMNCVEFAGASQPDLRDIPELDSVYPFDPDFGESPTLEVSLTRNLVGYAGTAQALYSLVDRDPAVVNMRVAGSDMPDLLDNFAAARGRLHRFAFREPSPWLYLAGEHKAGISALRVAATSWEPSRPGHEQLQYAHNGDLHTVTVASSTIAEGVMTLNLTAALAHDLSADTPLWRLFVGRYDVDALQLTYQTSRHGSASIRLRELIREYDA